MTETRDHIPARTDLPSLLAKIDTAMPRLMALMPHQVPEDRVRAGVRRAVSQDRRLLECSQGSVLAALADWATSGLPLDGRFSSLIVRKSRDGRPTASWDPSYRGMVSMALASGYVTEVQAFSVDEHDEFSVEYGTSPQVTHRPAIMKSGRTIAAYAWARMRSGELILEFLGRDDIERIRDASPAKAKNAPWSRWEAEMAKKSAMRRLLKRLPAAPAHALANAPDPVSERREALPAPSRPAAAPPPLLPEDESALEARALERLNDAADDAELAAAWAQTTAEYGRAGARPPRVLVAQYEQLLAGEPSTDDYIED